MVIGYRHTKTYIAASFDHDRDAVEKLYEWNRDNRLSFHFIDVHSLTQSYDSSRYCSIKRSLSDRMSVSKNFILIVGQHTNEWLWRLCSIALVESVLQIWLLDKQ